jgi:hypothetical protein
MNATALQILDDAKFDLFHGEARLVQAQGCAAPLAAGMRLIALEDLRSARERLDAVQRRVEDELYNRDQLEFLEERGWRTKDDDHEY